MTENEVKQALKLLNKGKSYGEVSLILGIGSETVRRRVRNYEVYGSSLFSLDPKPLVSLETEEVSIGEERSPFLAWLAQK